jgi:dethiobiotin synthetase
MHYFVTGTDTNVGKTYVTQLLIDALKREGRNVAAYKPVSCGDRTDAIALLQSCNDPELSLDVINPVYLKAPAAPLVAALLENKRVDLSVLRAGFDTLASRYETVLVEGSGGWEVPLNEIMTMADFAQALELPVIVVVNNKLGALNHTILTVRNIQSRNMTVAGVILNYVADERDTASISNRSMLERFLDVPILGEIMHGETEVEFSLAE